MSPQTFNYDNSDFKKFIIFTNYSINCIPVISKMFKGEVKELQNDEMICFQYFKDDILVNGFLNNYLKYKLKYNGEYKDKDKFVFLLDKFKNFDNFLKGYITYIIENVENMYFFHKNNNIMLEKVCKYLEIEKNDDYTNKEKIDILLKLYQKLIEKTEKTFELLFEYFDFYKCLGDKMKVITEEQKTEIKDKFDKMLEFLIHNKNNNKYNKDQIGDIVKNIKEVQKSNLFRFIFDDGNIKNKITELT